MGEAHKETNWTGLKQFISHLPHKSIAGPQGGHNAISRNLPFGHKY